MSTSLNPILSPAFQKVHHEHEKQRAQSVQEAKQFLFGDLSARSQMFRSALIEEFRIAEGGLLDMQPDQDPAAAANQHQGDHHLQVPSSNVGPAQPKFSSNELFIEGAVSKDAETHMMHAMLHKSPHELVKFKIFKRTAEDASVAEALGIDKRLVRVRNLGRVPLGVRAKWIVQHRVFSTLIVVLILCTAVVEALRLELSRNLAADAYDSWDLAFQIFDDFALAMFIVEIVLKWLDNFKSFWDDGWNVFDFVVTIFSMVPRLVEVFTTGYHLGVSSQSSQSSAWEVASQLRVFRTVRTLKFIARLPSLRIVISTVLDALSSLSFIILLLMLLLFIFTVFAINIFNEYTVMGKSQESIDELRAMPVDSVCNGDLEYTEKFDGLVQSFASLFQLLTLDQWYCIQQDFSKVVEPVIVILFFMLWIWIAAFVFRNVFVGVLVKKFQDMSDEASASEKKRRLARKQAKNVLKIQTTMQIIADQQLARQNSVAQAKMRDNSESAAKRRRGKNKVAPVASAPEGATDPEMTEERWHELVHETLDSLKQSAHKEEVMWPRDTLFEYLRAMEALQENMHEYQELQQLASFALLNLSQQ